MAPTSIITMAAAVCLVAVMPAVLAASSAPTSPPARLEEACKSAGQEEKLCVEALSSSPAAKTLTDTRGLARAAVLLAKENATGTTVHLADIYDDKELGSKPVALQQCVEDCRKRYDIAVAYLSDAAAALDKGSFDEAGVLIGGAQAEAQLCQRGCNAVGQQELTACNRNVYRLCAVAAAITRLLQQH